MTKFTALQQSIDNKSTLSDESASSTFLVKNLKPGQAKSATKSIKEGKVPSLPKMIVVDNNNDDKGWRAIIKGDRKAKSEGTGTGAIVTTIHEQKYATTGHGLIIAKPTTNPSKEEKKKNKKKNKKNQPEVSLRNRTKSNTVDVVDFDEADYSNTPNLPY